MQAMDFKKRMRKEAVEAISATAADIVKTYLDGKEDLTHATFLDACPKTEVSKIGKEHDKLSSRVAAWKVDAENLGFDKAEILESTGDALLLNCRLIPLPTASTTISTTTNCYYYAD